MIKVVYNKEYGGFSLSKRAQDLYYQKREEAGILAPVVYDRFIERHDPLLVQVVEELGDQANGQCARLGIEQIPKEYENLYTISEYDGTETVEYHPRLLVESKLKNVKLGN